MATRFQVTVIMRIKRLSDISVNNTPVFVSAVVTFKKAVGSFPAAFVFHDS
jgi:hypothetical protein